MRVVLETDGTQVEDGEYFQTLPENTIFIVLRPGEIWAPAGEDIVTQGSEHRTWSILIYLDISLIVKSKKNYWSIQTNS